MSTASGPMGNPAAKARTRTSAPGSKRRHTASSGRGRALAARGFTLIELLLVVALIAVASAVATLALRDPAASRLDQEAARLTALLESARGEARALGLPVTWRPLSKDAADAPGAAGDESTDFRFVGLPPSSKLPTRWLDRDVTAEIVGAPALVLGPEPIIGAQRVTLSLGTQRITLATDGLGPFAVVADAPAQASQ